MVENAFHYHLAQRACLLSCLLTSSPISSTPLGSRVIMIGAGIFSGVGRNGTLASRMFVAPEGSEKGAGVCVCVWGRNSDYFGEPIPVSSGP